MSNDNPEALLMRVFPGADVVAMTPDEAAEMDARRLEAIKQACGLAPDAPLSFLMPEDEDVLKAGLGVIR